MVSNFGKKKENYVERIINEIQNHDNKINTSSKKTENCFSICLAFFISLKISFHKIYLKCYQIFFIMCKLQSNSNLPQGHRQHSSYGCFSTNNFEEKSISRSVGKIYQGCGKILLPLSTQNIKILTKSLSGQVENCVTID